LEEAQMNQHVSAADGAPQVSQEDLDMLRENVARVLETQCDSQAVHAFIDGKSDLDRTLWATAAELGWLAMALPEAYGGLGLGVRGLDVLHRELGRRMAPGPFISTLAASLWLAELASESDRETWLPRIAAGEVTVAIPAALGEDAVLSLQGGRLSGQLRVLGSQASNLALVPVGAGRAVQSWALIAVDGQHAKAERLGIWDLTREVCTLTCDGAEPLLTVADTDGRASRLLSRLLALGVASDSVGGTAGIAHQTIAYFKTRKQFDRLIGSFQALKHRAADMVAGISTQEHLVAQGVEAAASEAFDADMWAALAKAGAGDYFSFVAGDCIQLHGGVGHTWEFDVHIYVKRARLNTVVGGDSRIQRDFAADELAKATRNGLSTMELAL